MKIELCQPQAIYEVGQRKNQEDAIYPAKGDATVENRVFMVCDGMGGHEQGEVASAAICEAMSQAAERLLDASRPFTDNDLTVALKAAEQALDQADTAKAGRMGTTMTFLCFHRGGCVVAHIGDSRIYHLRPQTGEILYRSRDHSLVHQLYEMGEISYNEMATHPRKNLILKAMQPYSERHLPSICHITDIQSGDYFYLCTDGMLEVTEDDELMAVLSSDDSDEVKVERLLAATKDNKDNHSAYLLRVKSVTKEPGDDALPEDEHEARLNNKALNDTRKNEAWTDVSDNDIEPVTPVQPITQPSSQPAEPTAPKKRRAWLWWLLLVIVAALVGAAIYFLKSQGEKHPSDAPQTELTTDESAGNQPSAQQDETAEEPQPAMRPKKTHEPDAMSPSPDEAKNNQIEETTPDSV